MLNELVRKAAREATGDFDPFEEHRKRPLSEHLADYRKYLAAKSGTSGHVKKTIRMIEKLLADCNVKRMPELNASAVASHLADARRAGLGVATSNHRLGACKSFTRWLVRKRRAALDPLAHLSRLNPRTDVRRERRELSAAEFDFLVAVTRESETEFRDLTGRDRATLYVVAANTGLRAAELASLTAASLNLEADQPTITVEAAYSKHRRRDVLPLRADLAGLLCPFVADSHAKADGKPQNRRGRRADQDSKAGQEEAAAGLLWPGSWAKRSAKMLRADMEAAKAAWIKKGATDREKAERAESDFLVYIDESGRVFDFHALRHQFISNLARAGASPKEAQTLARHSTITLTMDRYTHLGIVDLSAALDRLPKLPGSDALAAESNRQLATGTNDARPIPVAPPVAPDVAPSDGPSCFPLSAVVPKDAVAAGSTIAKKAEKTGPLGLLCPDLSDDDSSRPGRTRTFDQGIMSPLL